MEAIHCILFYSHLDCTVFKFFLNKVLEFLINQFLINQFLIKKRVVHFIYALVKDFYDDHGAGSCHKFTEREFDKMYAFWR